MTMQSATDGARGRAPLSVLITVPSGERLGGAEEMLWTLVRHVDRTRLRTHVVFLGDGDLATAIADEGIDTTVLRAGRVREVTRTARTVAELARLIRRVRPDVVLNWSAKSHYYGSTAARLADRRLPIVWWQHEIPKSSRLDRLAAAFPADAIGCSSQAAADAQRRVSPRKRIFAVHPGVELTPSDADASLVADGIPQLAPDTTVVGIVGRLQPWKGQDLFLEAIGQLVAAGHSLHALVVGGPFALSPDYPEKLRSLVDRLGLAAHVTMTGQVDDVARYMREIDVLVSASDNEPFGIVLIEAMRAEVPVVAIASGGPTEIVDDGLSGVLVHERSAAGLRAGLERILSDRDAAGEMGRAARRAVEERFTATAMTRRIEAELEATARRGQ